MVLKTAVILCGGKGTRLGAIGKKLPKTLVKIHNNPIIWYIIKILQKNNFNHFILPTGYKGNQIKEYFKKSRSFQNINIEVINTGLSTSIAKRIFKIKKKILSENFILLNGDAIFDFNINKIYTNHINKKIDTTFMSCSTKLPFGVIAKKNGKIIDFIRNIQFNAIKKRGENNLTGYVYSGIAILKKSLLERNFHNFENFEKLFYPYIIKKKKTQLEQIDGFWHSIDNYKDINDVNNRKNKIKYFQIKKIIKKINDIE